MSATLPMQGPSAAAGAFGLLLAAIAFTLAWFGFVALFPDLQASGLLSVIVRLLIHAAILAGLWLALARTSFDAGTRLKLWLVVVIPFTAWLTLVWWLAVDGAFRPRPGVPAVPIAIFLPLLVALPVLLRSKRIGAVLDAAPPSWLVGLQVYRVFGGIFLVAWSRGTLSGTFALPAGTGDLLVGLLALPVAHLLYKQLPAARSIAVGWNILGLVDFAIAIGIGILSAPGPLRSSSPTGQTRSSAPFQPSSFRPSPSRARFSSMLCRCGSCAAEGATGRKRAMSGMPAGDRAAAAMAERAEALARSPPPAEWDGVFVQAVKQP